MVFESFRLSGNITRPSDYRYAKEIETMERKSDWNYPEPRKGLPGQWDKFIGPGATRAEQAIALVPAIVAAFAITWYAYAYDLGWNSVQYIVAALLALDMIGGVMTNATSSAKRWYHRSNQTALHHLGFVAIHVLQIFLVAWLFRDLDMTYIVIVYSYLIVSAATVLFVPLRLQRSTALLFVCGAILMSEYVFVPTPGLEWFIPILFVKLLLSHLTVEEPYI